MLLDYEHTEDSMTRKKNSRTVPNAEHIGGHSTSPWSRLAKFASAIVIGFDFDDLQKAALRKVGVVIMSVQEALSSGRMDADYVGVNVSLEKTGIKRLVKRSGTITLSSDEASLVDMLTSRRFESEEGAP
ncbi:MAG TPA: hypothetical protein VJJ48_00035 [Candidatus Paceibacterota bacterium]